MELNGAKDIPILHRVKDKVVGHGGSIVLDHYNAEILLPPARGDAFIEMVHDVFDELKLAKPWFAAGPTIFSGYHLHVDGRDLKYRHLGHVMIMYSKYEPLIIQSQPYARFVGKFCKPNGPSLGEGWEAASQGAAAQEMIFKSKAQQATPNGSQNRYKAVNFAAWYKYHTIEVRSHEGTTEADDVIQWASLWTNFVQNAKDIPYKTANKHVPSMDGIEDLLGGTGAAYLSTRIKKYACEWSTEKVASFLDHCALYEGFYGYIVCPRKPVKPCVCASCKGQKAWCILHEFPNMHMQWK